MIRPGSKRPVELIARNVSRTGQTENMMPRMNTDPPGGKPAMISDTGKFLLGAATISTGAYFAYSFFNPRRQPNFRPEAQVPPTKEAIDSAMNRSIVPPVVTISDPTPQQKAKLASLADTAAAGPSTAM